MPANQAHPDISQLNAFALGRLDPPEIDAVESHLASCDTCCDALKQMKEDTFVGLVRDARQEQRRDGEAAPVPASLQEAATLPTSETPPAQAPAERAANADSDAATVAPSGDTAVPGDLPAEMLDHPRYHVLELLGVGGMGAVYKAEHRLMQRTVALKVINPKFIQSRQAVERFRREVQAAARLQHPNIVHAYDAEQAGNVHFLVMEYVKGTDLNQVLQERGPLPVNEACAYIRQAALGLQHAHEMGMVHRDIKPQNLMVVGGGVVSGGVVKAGNTSLPARTTHDSPLTSRQVKILDFGLAALTSQATEESSAEPATVDNQKSGLTQAGTLMGTPDYMAPEQARDARGADIRSDIYSLGCTLYTLLAGTVPYPGGSAVDKVIAHASNPARPIQEVRGDVPAGVAGIVDKMMAKEPAKRFQTPAEVAAALTRFAESPAASTAPRRGRSAGRRAALAAIAAGALMLLAGVIFIRTNNGTLKIDCEVDDVQVVVSQGGEQLEVIDVPTGSTVKRLPSGNYDIALKGKNLNVKLDTSGFTITRSGLAVVRVTLTDETREAKIEAATRAAEKWLSLLDAGHYEQAWEGSAALSRKMLGKQRAVAVYQQLATQLGKLKWRALVRRDHTHSPPNLPRGDYVNVYYGSNFERMPQAMEVVSLAREKDGQWRPVGYGAVLWTLDPKDFPNGPLAVERFVGHNGKVIRVALSPSGHLLASTGEDNTVRVWDAKTGKQLHEFATKFTPVPVAISPDGELVAAIVCPGPFPDKVIIWQIKDGKKLFEFPMISGWTGCIAFSPDSRHVAWAEAFGHKAPDDAIRIVDARTGKEVRVIRNTKEVIANWTLAFSPDGAELACAGKDGVLNVWDPATGKHLREIKGHTQQITRVDYSPDGKHIITGSLDKSVKVWNAKTGELVRSVDGHGAGVTSTFSRDGRRLVSKAADHSLEVWDAFTDQKVATLPGHTMGLMHVVISSDGKFIASGSFDNTARLWKMPDSTTP